MYQHFIDITYHYCQGRESDAMRVRSMPTEQYYMWLEMAHRHEQAATKRDK
jgi:hypothetical protein